MTLKQIKSNKLFGSELQQYEHQSDVNQCAMRFSIYLPQCASNKKVPVLYWLSGLTCTDENFMQKSGAQRIANDLGMAIVAPDTSPRGNDVPDDENGSYDFGLGAGFYVNATQAPWSKNYNMYDYVVNELPALIEANFPVTNQRAISGHSMGGHGALVIGFRNQDKYSSISAFSPIVNPMESPWGQKALGNYLGENREDWCQYDTCELLKSHGAPKVLVKVSQGESDEFLAEQLKTENLEKLEMKNITVDRLEGYDHSYYFIASFIEEHLKFHHQAFNNL